MTNVCMCPFFQIKKKTSGEICGLCRVCRGVTVQQNVVSLRLIGRERRLVSLVHLEKIFCRYRRISPRLRHWV